MKIGKRIFAILIILLHIGCNTNKGNDLKINGDVKEVNIIKYSVKYDSLERIFYDTILKYKAILDKKGKIQSTAIKTYVNNKYRFTTISNFKYNWKGQLIQEAACNLPDSLKFNINYIYQNRFITRGLLEKVISIDTIFGYSSFVETYKYTPNGLLSERKSTTLVKDKRTNDTISYMDTTFKYDRNGNLIESKWYDSGNKLKGKEIYSYNDKGLRISKKKFDKNGIEVESVEYKYVLDSLQNWTEKQSFKNDRIIEVQKRKIIN